MRIFFGLDIGDLARLASEPDASGELLEAIVEELSDRGSRESGRLEALVRARLVMAEMGRERGNAGAVAAPDERWTGAAAETA